MRSSMAQQVKEGHDVTAVMERLDRCITGWADRFAFDPDDLASSLKPTLDALSCLALARSLGIALPPDLAGARPSTGMLEQILGILHPNLADAQFLPVILSLAYRNGVVSARQSRSYARDFGLAKIVPLGTDLLTVLTVEVPKLDLGVPTGARSLFFGRYASDVLMAPHRLQEGDLASGYFLTHHVFFATGFGQAMQKLDCFPQLVPALVKLGWLALQSGCCDLLGEVIICLALLNNREAIDPAWAPALIDTVNPEGWAMMRATLSGSPMT